MCLTHFDIFLVLYKCVGQCLYRFSDTFVWNHATELYAPSQSHHLKVREDKCGITLPYAENANISAVLCVMWSLL